MSTPTWFVGIDVSKAHLDVALRPHGAPFRLANSAAGIAELVARLLPLAPALIVLEATGGYETPAVAACLAAGLPIVAVNPRQARDFAKGVGQLAKTDAIDAAVLAHFAEVVRPPVRPEPPAARQALEALLTRRQQLIEIRVMETNRLAVAADAALRAGLTRHLAWLDGELADVGRHLDAAVEASPNWRAQDALLQSIPGIGPTTSRTLLAALPELGTIRGGRFEVRRMLYLAALSATRHGGPLKEFNTRLRARGKRGKVAVIAVARKLVRIANAVLRTQTPWNAELAKTR